MVIGRLPYHLGMINNFPIILKVDIDVSLYGVEGIQGIQVSDYTQEI